MAEIADKDGKEKALRPHFAFTITHISLYWVLALRSRKLGSLTVNLDQDPLAKFL